MLHVAFHHHRGAHRGVTHQQPHLHPTLYQTQSAARTCRSISIISRSLGITLARLLARSRSPCKAAASSLGIWSSVGSRCDPWMIKTCTGISYMRLTIGLSFVDMDAITNTPNGESLVGNQISHCRMPFPLVHERRRNRLHPRSIWRTLWICTRGCFNARGSSRCELVLGVRQFQV